MNDNVKSSALFILHGLVSRGENLTKQAISNAVQGARDFNDAIDAIEKEEEGKTGEKRAAIAAIAAEIQKRGDPLEILILNEIDTMEPHLFVERLAASIRKAFPAAAAIAPATPADTTATPPPPPAPAPADAPTTGTGNPPAP